MSQPRTAAAAAAAVAAARESREPAAGLAAGRSGHRTARRAVAAERPERGDHWFLHGTVAAATRRHRLLFRTLAAKRCPRTGSGVAATAAAARAAAAGLAGTATGSGHSPQGQYGGGFQPAQSSQYGGLGAFGAEPKKPKASKKPLLIGGIAAAVVIAGGVGAWLLGAFSGDTLDQKSVQDGVARVLNEHYGEPDVKNVSCPSGQPVENGTTFDCSIDLRGSRRRSRSGC